MVEGKFYTEGIPIRCNDKRMIHVVIWLHARCVHTAY